MHETLKTLLEKLGVDHMLSAYETQPWLCYDAERGMTCSAEVRMGPGAEDLEAELQFLHDKIPENEDGDDKSDDEGPGDRSSYAALMEESERKAHEPPRKKKPQTISAEGIEQIMILRALPYKDGHWSVQSLTVKGKDYMNKLANWDEKGCAFFKACVQSIAMGEAPSIEDLIESELSDDDEGSGSRGRIGRKSPKVNPAALMGMNKKGM